MTDMTLMEPADAVLDRRIEEMIGQRVRGELDAEGEGELGRLIAARGKQMRPDPLRGVPTPPRRHGW